jgi:hypothetical protein
MEFIFLLFIKAIEYCLRDGFTELESGATSYEYKKLIGSEIVNTFVYYRHKQPIAHWLLNKVNFLLAPSATELK